MNAQAKLTHKRRTREQIERDRQQAERRVEAERISAASPTWSEWIAAQRCADAKAQGGAA